MSQDDRAWVDIPTPLTAAALAAFCADTERLLRINPLSEFSAFKRLAADRYHLEFRNLSIEKDIAADIAVTRESGANILVTYEGGLKASTRFEILPHAQGSLLRITDDYGRLPAEERRERLDEVDRSLTAWGQALQEYLVRHKRWAWCPPWRWYMRGLWVPMKPMGRRVSFMIILINLSFFALFLFVMLIYWLEQTFNR